MTDSSVEDMVAYCACVLTEDKNIDICPNPCCLRQLFQVSSFITDETGEIVTKFLTGCK